MGGGGEEEELLDEAASGGSVVGRLTEVSWLSLALLAPTLPCLPVFFSYYVISQQT